MKINVIGLGYWQHYPRLVSEHEDCELAMVCDLKEENLEKVKSKYPDVITTTNIDDMIHSDIENVIVCTPVTTHYKIVRDLLMAGKNIMCEKAFTLKGYQASELVEIADANNLILMVGHTFIYNSLVQKIKQFLLDGYLGDIYYVNMVRVGMSPVRQDVNCIYDLSAHDISMVIDWFGMPKYVSAFGNSYLKDKIEDVANINLEFENKTIVNIMCSWLSPQKERKITIVGSKRKLVFDDIEKSLTIFDNDGEHKIDIEYKQPLAEQVNDFYESVTYSRQPIVGGYEGYQVVKVLEACNESLKQRAKEQ
jgi:predicted dehydrogenase